MLVDERCQCGEVIVAGSEENIIVEETYDDPFPFDDVTSPRPSHGPEDEQP